jgi:2',3'-cyclic-nucleotide 2'-phosphodiesterase (5'-nucleotidase family)
MVGNTAVAQAHYNGRKVGRADITVNPSGAVTVSWSRLTVGASNNPPVTAEDPTIKALITTYSSDPAYQTLINTEIGYTNVPIVRNYDGDSLMGYFVNDAIYNDLNTDTTTANDVDMVFNNPGGLRADITCAAYPCLVNYGMTFNVLPFGNQTIVGDMRGDKILELLHQSATLFKGAIQPAGIHYSFYRYTDSIPSDGTVWAWGAFDATVYNKVTHAWEPLDLKKTYRVSTNEFLAPAGQDGFVPFKYMTNISYWGDMLDGVNRWVNKTYTSTNPYNAALDGRITRVGTDSGGSIVPLTILHHNDSHGNLTAGTYVGYTQLATLIKQEKLHNPTRTLLFHAGDTIQGDGMAFYYKSSYTGKAVDGTDLTSLGLTVNPIVASMNALGYDAMTLGNHEFNFGNDVFKGVLGQANFAILDANVTDGAGGNTYGLKEVGVEPYIEKTLDGIKIGIIGLGNPRIPNYELASNISGLAFANTLGVDDPITRGQALATTLRDTNNDDVVLALTHLGFTDATDPWVDTYLAANTSGIDAIIGGHSHTDPTNAAHTAPYKYLPSIIPAADGKAVSISHAYRYNNYLGEVVLGVRAKVDGGYEVVSQTGRYLKVTSTTLIDSNTNNLLAPYQTLFNTYNSKIVGTTSAPIDALQAFTQETTGANIQADAAVYELSTKRPDVTVDFHLSGAMTNKAVATNATLVNPVTLKVSDMFALMPYENSLLVLQMNGPQLKTVLERAYRNYYYYKYDTVNHGNYSYYTTCMLDTNSGNQIKYNDLYPALPNNNNVVWFKFGDTFVDFTDASTYYNVSTVNYLAAGSCNFNDGPGTSLWPLNQLVADTQYYVRDAVIDYLSSKGTVSPAIEGRVSFITDTAGPVITITSPGAKDYLHTDSLKFDFGVTDAPAGVAKIEAKLDGSVVTNGQTFDLFILALGEHTFTVNAWDKAGNQSTQLVKFNVIATIQSLKDSVNRFYSEGKIKDAAVYQGLMDKLKTAQMYLDAGNVKAAKNTLTAFINQVNAQTGKKITKDAATLLITDAQDVIANPK